MFSKAFLVSTGCKHNFILVEQNKISDLTLDNFTYRKGSLEKAPEGFETVRNAAFWKIKPKVG